jgi:DNA-directed RNA polymerase specialized sigma24 family protein
MRENITSTSNNYQPIFSHVDMDRVVVANQPSKELWAEDDGIGGYIDEMLERERRETRTALEEWGEVLELSLYEIVLEGDIEFICLSEGSTVNTVGKGRGIDLGERSSRSGVMYKADEVRKLLYSGFMGKMLSAGYDPEDVLQEVYRGLLVRNQGRCPYDGEKSSFGYYVHMVISCILANYHRKEERRVDDVFIEDGGDIGQWGVTEDSCELLEGLDLEDLGKFLRSKYPDGEIACRVMPYMIEGYSRREIREKTGLGVMMVNRGVNTLHLGIREFMRL